MAGAGFMTERGLSCYLKATQDFANWVGKLRDARQRADVSQKYNVKSCSQENEVFQQGIMRELIGANG